MYDFEELRQELKGSIRGRAMLRPMEFSYMDGTARAYGRRGHIDVSVRQSSSWLGSGMLKSSEDKWVWDGFIPGTSPVLPSRMYYAIIQIEAHMRPSLPTRRRGRSCLTPRAIWGNGRSTTTCW